MSATKTASRLRHTPTRTQARERSSLTPTHPQIGRKQQEGSVPGVARTRACNARAQSYGFSVSYGCVFGGSWGSWLTSTVWQLDIPVEHLLHGPCVPDAQVVLESDQVLIDRALAIRLIL